ncbi:diguanylate cyclase (GGDEF) domain-containing protein [Lachnospiraceae bacterium JC7]|nr:diguanylate cyclase (GGDEF) domain-containing protein [Lachnospiraceae bacterium JC7]
MTYSSTAIVALLVHCIINNDVIRNQHYRNTTPAGKTYRLLVLSVAAFYISDIFWGILYEEHMIAEVFADTVIYFALMAATVFLWTRYVVNYLQENSWLNKALYYIGWFFLAAITVVLILNFFVPVMFWFDEEGVFCSGQLRYDFLIIQVIMFMFSAGYVLFISKGKNKSEKRHHRAIGLFGFAIAILLGIQVTNPLLPLYTVGWLLGTCILHTFVLEDMKEDRILELEEMLLREEKQKKELGSARQLAFRDSLTGVKSYNAYVEAEQQINERIASGELQEFGVVVFDVNGLKLMNDTHGHEAGDRLLKDACHLICAMFKHSPVFRIGGDEFVVLLEGEDYQHRMALLADFEWQAEVNQRNGSTVVASGLSTFSPGEDNAFRKVFERADARMYDRKRFLKAKE